MFADSDFMVVKYNLLRNIGIFKHQIHMRQTANIICDCNVPHEIEKNTIIGYYDESTNETTTIYRAKVHKTATKRSQKVEIISPLTTKLMKISKRNVCCIEQHVLSDDEDEEEDEEEEEEEEDEDLAAYIQNLKRRKPCWKHNLRNGRTADCRPLHTN